MEELEADVQEVVRLLNNTNRNVTRRCLLQLLSSLQTTIAQYRQQQQASQIFSAKQLHGTRQDSYELAQSLLLPSPSRVTALQNFLPTSDLTFSHGTSAGGQVPPLTPDALQIAQQQAHRDTGSQALDSAWSSFPAAPQAAYGANGYAANGYAANGYTANGYAAHSADSPQLAGLSNPAYNTVGPPASSSFYAGSPVSMASHDLPGLGNLFPQENHLPQQLPELTLARNLGSMGSNGYRANGLRGLELDRPSGSLPSERANSGDSNDSDGMGQFVQMYRMAQDSLQGQLAQMSLSSTEDSAAQVAFRALSTCSWEQTDSIVKVYVPLRGVQTELLRAVFEPTFVEVKVVNLKGKNYCFSINCTFRPINPSACLAVASKTKKNILITIKKLNCMTLEDKHWQDLYRHR